MPVGSVAREAPPAAMTSREGAASLIEAGSEDPRLPVLLSSPHSGTAFPEGFLGGISLPCDDLRPLSDGPIDRLLRPARRSGIASIRGLYSRAVIDLNRDPCELAPGLLATPGKRRLSITPKVRAGLGVIPTRVGGMEIYRRRIGDDELAWRIDQVHAPYHAAIGRGLASLRARFGEALLIDCHSMPACSTWHNGRRLDVVLGDRFGRTADRMLMEMTKSICEAAGLMVGVNHPFPGGYITQHHGRPGKGIFAIQVELRRGLFMEEATHELHSGARRTGELLRDLALELGELLIRRGRAAAA